jgi:hypothetical protein
VNSDGTDVVVCPGRDQIVRAGESVHLIGPPDQLDEYGLTWRPEATKRVERGRNRPIHLVRHTLASLFAESDRSLRMVLAALAVLVAIASTVLMIGYRKPDGTHMTLLDALYFSVETIATIGYATTTSPPRPPGDGPSPSG